MAKLMIITVGTSLFHSASWDENNQDFLAEIDGYKDIYKEWTNPSQNLSPEERKASGSLLVNFLKETLDKDNAKKWADYLYDPAKINNLMRYSAEFSTLLNYLRSNDFNDWEEDLKQYEFRFMCDKDENNENNIAAHHLKHQLIKLINAQDGQVDIEAKENFSNLKPEELIHGLKEYQKYIKTQLDSRKYSHIEIVVSGGFKIYGLVSYGFLLNDRVKVIYQHELADTIFRQTKDKAFTNKSSFAFSAIPR